MFGNLIFLVMLSLGFMASPSVAVTTTARARRRLGELPTNAWPTQILPTVDQEKIGGKEGLLEVQEHHLNVSSEVFPSAAEEGEEQVPMNGGGAADPAEEGVADPEPCESICNSFSAMMSNSLPNVLVIGDNTSLGYFVSVQAMLLPVAAVHHAPLFNVPGKIPSDSCGTSAGVNACMDKWLGNGTVFKVIIFNWGLVDVRLNGWLDESYTKQIKEMYVKMKHHTGEHGHVVWLNTAPVSPFNIGPSTNEQIDHANELVERMWKDSNDPPAREDLNEVVTHSCRLEAAQKPFPDNVECSSLMEPQSARFNLLGQQFMAMYTADTIRKYL